MKKIKNFLIGVKKESHKVRWPSKKEMAAYSVATIVCVVLFGLFFTGLDFIISLAKEVLH